MGRDAAERSRSATIWVSKPPKDCRMTAGLSVRLSMMAA
jgi:hypothetical protein